MSRLLRLMALSPLLICSTAFARSTPSTMTEGVVSVAPYGYVQMCRETPQLCATSTVTVPTATGFMPVENRYGAVSIALNPPAAMRATAFMTGNSPAVAPDLRFASIFAPLTGLKAIPATQFAIGLIDAAPAVATPVWPALTTSAAPFSVELTVTAPAFVAPLSPVPISALKPLFVAEPIITAPIVVTANVPARAADSAGKKTLMRMLRQVNRRINSKIAYRPDVGEHWGRPEGALRAAGDCEDFAIEKRLELIAAGFPADRLSYAVGFISGVGLHTVLVADVDGTDLVLDNRIPWIEKWSRSPYTWVLKQSRTDASKWHSTIEMGQTSPAQDHQGA